MILLIDKYPQWCGNPESKYGTLLLVLDKYCKLDLIISIHHSLLILTII